MLDFFLSIGLAVFLSLMSLLMVVPILYIIDLGLFNNHFGKLLQEKVKKKWPLEDEH